MTRDRTAIRAVGLTKQYWVVGGAPSGGGDYTRYQTLRETLTEWPKRLLWRSDAARKEPFFALRGVSFEVPEGTVMGIVGRNGSGKTTLLKILARITSPTVGYAELRGRLGSLLEVGTGFHPELTGRENIFLSGAVLGMSRADIARQLEEIVAFAEVERFLDTPLKRYSSGMYLRLAFAVAAHLETEIILVDEVLAVGDLQFRLRCLGKMREVGAGGRTVLYVSHDLASIRQLCDSAIWLDAGRIVACGTAEEVTARYEAEAYHRFTSSRGTFRRDPAETKGKTVWFEQVELRDAQDRLCASFQWGDELRLVMRLGGQAPTDGFTIEWGIHNERGERAAFGSANPQQNVYFDRYDRVIECAIGPLWLTSGAYRIWLSVRVWNQGRWDMWDDAAMFHLALADPFGTGFNADSVGCGVVVIPHRWRTMERDPQPRST